MYNVIDKLSDELIWLDYIYIYTKTIKKILFKITIYFIGFGN